MEKEAEQETQNTPEEEVLTEEQISDLKHRAEVSSQNYEIRKKIEKENEALKEKLEQLETQLDSSDPDILEERRLVKEIESLKETVANLKAKNELSEVEAVYGKYPVLREKLQEFDEFKENNRGMSLEVAAKAFLIENDLLETPKKKGLEPARGGVKTAPSSSKMSVEDVRRLRETNYREYKRLNDEGKIRL